MGVECPVRSQASAGSRPAAARGAQQHLVVAEQLGRRHVVDGQQGLEFGDPRARLREVDACRSDTRRGLRVARQGAAQGGAQDLEIVAQARRARQQGRRGAGGRCLEHDAEIGFEGGGRGAQGRRAQRRGQALQRMGAAARRGQVVLGQRMAQRGGFAVVDELPQQALVELHAAVGGPQAGLRIEAGHRGEAIAQRRGFVAAALADHGPGQLAGKSRRRRDGGRGGGRGRCARQPAQQGGVQRLGIDRLGDMVVHARSEAGVAVFVEGVRGHGQDRGGRVGRQRADPARRLQPVHHRHLDVHQDQVVGAVARHGEGGLADVGQQFQRHLLVDGIVFGQQDAAAAALPQGGFRLAGCEPGHRAVPAGERLLHRLEQAGRRHRLLHDVEIAGRRQHFRLQPVAVGGDQQARRLPRQGQRGEAAAELDAVG